MNSDLETKIRESEKKRDEYDRLIGDNQSKLAEYDSLYKFKLTANEKISDADSKIKSANDEVAEWNRKFDEEHKLREKLEQELANLKKQLQPNSNHENGENIQQDQTEFFDGDHPHNEENYSPNLDDLERGNC